MHVEPVIVSALGYFQNQSAAATSCCAPFAALPQLQAFIALLLLVSADRCFPTLMYLRHSLPPTRLSPALSAYLILCPAPFVVPPTDVFIKMMSG